MIDFATQIVRVMATFALPFILMGYVRYLPFAPKKQPTKHPTPNRDTGPKSNTASRLLPYALCIYVHVT